MKNVAIIDYQLSNLFSVKHACEHVGLNAQVTSDPNVIQNADGLILPGVGAFKDAMENLNNLKIAQEIRVSISKGKPFLGICLGMQLLFSTSNEFGTHKGLDIIQGEVIKFPSKSPETGKKIRIPAIGWNKIYTFSKNEHQWDSTPLKDVHSNSFMYFVHSYFVKPKNEQVILTMTNYEGVEYCSGVQKDNVVAFQFHPEKSGKGGISIYKNWSKTII